MEKCVWIYFMLACEFEPRAIKYIVKSKYFNKKILCMKNSSNRTFIDYCLLNSFDTIKMMFEMDFIDYDTIFPSTDAYNIIPSIMYSLLDINKFKYILEKIPKIKELFEIKFSNKLTMFSFSCYHNADTAKYLLDNGFINQSIFNELYDDNLTCLTLSLLKNGELFKQLIEHSLCTPELFKYSHPKYGNVLNIAINHKQDYIENIKF